MTLIDSDVLIAHLRGIEPARQWLRDERTSGPLAVSAVTVTEIAGGMRSGERREVWQLLSSMRFETVDELVARQAGALMRRYKRENRGIGLGDYLIAATAQVRGHELATLNVKHFPMFEGLRPAFVLDG